MLPGKKYTPDEYLRIAWKRRWFIAVPLVIIASTTSVVAFFLPNRYRASTSILVIPQRVPEDFVQSTVTAELGERLNIISPADSQSHAAGANHPGIQPLRART